MAGSEAANKPPRVSIGVPVYNGAATLAAALDSLINQTLADIEIIISDNGSTDDTPAICQAYAARDPRIRYHRQPVVMHDYTRNFNFVLQEARAPYFMWAAHDDTRDLDFLEKAVAALEANPRGILAFGDVVEMVDGQPRPLPLDFVNAGLPPAERLRKAALLQLHHLYGLWRTAKLRSILWEHVNWWHDTPLMMAATMTGDFVYVPGIRFYYLYNTHPFFNWKRRGGLAGLAFDARKVAERARDLGLLVYLSYGTVAAVGGPVNGLLAAWYALRKVADQVLTFTARRI